MGLCISLTYTGTKQLESDVRNSRSSTCCENQSHAKAAIETIGRVREERALRGVDRKAETLCVKLCVEGGRSERGVEKEKTLLHILDFRRHRAEGFLRQRGFGELVDVAVEHGGGVRSRNAGP